MLQKGARKVYSVDVGHGQLDWKLRSDDRVVCMEKTNFRYMKPGDIEDMLSFASVDVSFISLTKILLPARELLEDRGQMVCLIKPQFEAGREKVGKKGVVKDPLVHREVIGKVMDFADFIGFEILHLDFSPVKGPEGNIEYLLHLEKSSGRALETVSVTEAEAEKELKNITEEKRGYSSSDEMRNILSRTVTLAHAELKAGDS
ncbi:MAG: TlyA family RNA methyltransferase, partial [Lachnospiraceae bacterium]|nr:TlyA family RNA methyltransferase [Lachnospiraceae bacterium]